MKITQDVRDYAAKKGLEDQAALEIGMKEKAEEFKKAGSQIYVKASQVPEGTSAGLKAAPKE
jgi:hypothetical protein